MNIGMIGLGKMGSNMALRLMRGGHRCTVFDLKKDSVVTLAKSGAAPAYSVEELVKALPKPRAIWIMVPAGEATESMVMKLKDCLDSGDVIVDGGNSYFKDDVRRSKVLNSQGIKYMDAGTSGGIWGNDRGYCLMIGGEQGSFEWLEPIFKTLAPGPDLVSKTPGTPGATGRKTSSTVESGYLYCGPVGSGHFVKMVHNGIEYGLMQAFAEGFDILKGASRDEVHEEHRFKLNLDEVAEVWRRGSVVSSWLLDLLAIAMKDDPLLSQFEGFVHDSGEGRWTVQAAIEESVPADVISAALFARFRSRQEHTFAEKVLSAMRREFGGHIEEAGRAETNSGTKEQRKIG